MTAPRPLRPAFPASPAILAVALVLSGCASLGRHPSKPEQRTYASSPNFDAARGVFLNLPEPELDSFWIANRAAFRAGIDVSYNGPGPDFTLPQVRPDFAEFTSGGTGALKAIWIGHSSVALRIGGATVLLDPVFGRASPLSFYGYPRFQAPPFRRDDLPDVDVILVSHEHYDHLERATVEHFAKKGTRFVVPLGIGSHLRYWGVRPDRITELDWWDSVTVGNVTFTATPAWHSSGRRQRGENRTQWASWVLRTPEHRVFFSGDGGYGSHFRAIGERFGPFDVALLETGQYSRAWRAHLKPGHWPVVLREIRATNWLPIHWGVFSFAPHDWDEPIRLADSIAREHGLRLLTPRQGEITDLRQPQAFTRWWIRDGNE